MKSMITPKIVAEVLHPIIKDKIFCDLGAANGFLLEACREYGASKVIGVEMNHEKSEKMREKGIDVVEKNILSGDFVIPDADIYYNFMHTYVVEDIWKLIPSGKTLIVGALRSKFNEETMPSWVKDYPIKLDIPFKPNEENFFELFMDGKTPPEKMYWRIAIIKKNE